MTLSQRALSGFYLFAGTLHFVRPEMYEEIMPGYLPAHRELVLISGAAEIAGAAGVALPRTRRAAGWCLIALLIAVFPANLHMALNPERYKEIPELLLWARLPLQAAAMWWAYRATHPRD